MSSPDEPTSRLTEALDHLTDGTTEPVAGEPFRMPEIVPATADAPVVADPPQAPPSPAAQPASAPFAPTLPPTGNPPITRPVMPPVANPSGWTATNAAPSVPAPAPAPAPAPRQTGWGDHMAATASPAAGQPLRSAGRRPRVRKVTRVLRHIDPWSTFKVALVFSLVTYLVVLTSGVLLWRVADSTGTLDNVERWFTQFGWETFELQGGQIFHNAWIIGLFGAVALTGLAVLMATLFNLVSDIVGGVRMTVLEEEVVERTISSTRRYVVRRPPISDDTGGISAPAWSLDDDADTDLDDATSSRYLDDTQVQPAVQTDRQPPAATAEAASDWSVDDDDPIPSG